ncbi:MAG: AMP-binding protein [Actinomycetales bacterium]|nr:AMP-binding protein [Actinomycetales bacterium]
MASLDGSGPPLLPYAAGSQPPVLPDASRGRLPDGLALVVSTSGSTGIPKRTMLTANNLLASAGATHDVLSGPGSWLLALPAHHIAGLQVIVRAGLGSAGEPTVMNLDGGFTVEGFAAAARKMPNTPDPTYVSLVPTQVARLLDDPLGVETLAAFDAVLCGAAAMPSDMQRRAGELGVRLVGTFGMTETAGGCIYDGLPLPVSEMHIDNDRHIVLGGATVAAGYLGDPALTADHFSVDADGVRWFRAEDLGFFDTQGQLHVTGRADEIINTGGVKVAPGPIEDALVRFLPGVHDAVVVGVPDAEWGQVVAAMITLAPRTARVPTVQDARAALRGVVSDAALPRLVLVVSEFPVKGPGKPDRVAISAAFSSD